MPVNFVLSKYFIIIQTFQDLRKEMKQFAQRVDHDTASASVVVVLSHGRNGAITGN